MRYHINEILRFIRDNDSSKLYKDKSNTFLRKSIRACLEKESIYFVYRGPLLVGFIEWYRIKNCQYLVKTIRHKKYLNSNPSGRIIFVQNAVFIKGYLTLRVFKKFAKYHKNINQIIWFKNKNKKFVSIRINN